MPKLYLKTFKETSSGYSDNLTENFVNKGTSFAIIQSSTPHITINN